MSLVEFKGVYKRYRMGEITINAVDGISFSVEKGEFAVLVGASGEGYQPPERQGVDCLSPL